MAHRYLETATTPSVRAVQAEMGSRELWEDIGAQRDASRFTARETAFVAARDSFYLATVSETGWPYVQHRGGPRGFLKVIDETTLAFADYRGNRQYLTAGNIAASARAALFLMDYPNRKRLKIYAQAETVPLAAAPALAARVVDPAYDARPERIITLRLVAFSWNCPQHITPRFTEAEIAEATQPLRERLTALETENAALRSMLAARTGV